MNPAAPQVCVTVGEEIAAYGFPHHHPFGTFRHDAFWQEAQRRGLDRRVQVLSPVMATPEELHRFHTPEYVDRVRALSLTGTGLLDRGDTPAFVGVYEAASFVVGSALDLMRRMMRGECRRAFIPIAGLHHAQPSTAGGFCVFNDCGVVIHSVRQEFGLKRIAYVDIDAHHGDGVFYAFESDPELIFADIHEDGHFLYPGTGHAYEEGLGAAKGRKLNIPAPMGADDRFFHREWPRVEALLTKFAPEFILLQCGADSVAGDPLTHMGFSPEAHGHAAERLSVIAESLGHGRVLAVGGGGYDPVNIAQAWCAVVEGLLKVPGP
ncbi:MAG: acetoin utilization protein AcuC [Magnetococcales bacterium]|nr:acetoin utilization protein AcuC [Magnetococcales bacterium]